MEVKLQSKHIKELDEISAPTLNFPAEFIANAGPFGYGGATINSESFDVNPLAPTKDSERYEETLV